MTYNDLQNTATTLKIQQRELTNNRESTHVLRKGWQFLLH